MNLFKKKPEFTPVDDEPMDDFMPPMPSGPSRRQQANEIGAWAGMTAVQLLFYLLMLIAIGVVLKGGG